MGLLGKVFGLEKKGKIALTVDKPSYIAGELVVGTISISIFEPVQCDAVILKATGKEKVKWEEQHTETDSDGQSHTKTEHFDREHEFFKQKARPSFLLFFHERIVISSIPHTYMPGEYVYPFEYQLPSDLSGVFFLNDYSSAGVRDLTCKISYKLKATLDVGGFLAKDLKATRELIVHEKLMQTITPSRDETTQNVRFLCCIDKGTCHLDVAMDKNVYLAGETAQIHCKIHNGSQVDITSMRCKLIQDIHLMVHGHVHHFSRQLCVQQFAGVPASTTLEQPQPLPLVCGSVINPSTTGKLIKCSYRVDIECDIPWCPDVHLNLPVTIIAPMLVVFSAWGAPPPGAAAHPQ